MRFLIALALCAAAVYADDAVLRRMDSESPHYAKLSRQIWELAEVGYQETKSSALLADELKRAGFRVETGVANMPTAFTATWGQGKPVIAIIGEYDALPGLSQDTVPEKKPITPAPMGTAVDTTHSV